jgi:hypothetical protein
MAKNIDKITTTVMRISIIVIVCFSVIVAARFIFGGPEDDWICVRGQWVMHGKPAAAKPTTPCVE